VRNGVTRYFSIDRGNQGSGGEINIPHQLAKGAVVKLFPNGEFKFADRSYGTIDLTPVAGE
jgi:hypothetical protein